MALRNVSDAVSYIGKRWGALFTPGFFSSDLFLHCLLGRLRGRPFQKKVFCNVKPCNESMPPSLQYQPVWLIGHWSSWSWSIPGFLSFCPIILVWARGLWVGTDQRHRHQSCQNRICEGATFKYIVRVVVSGLLSGCWKIQYIQRIVALKNGSKFK